jgi:hypothetical protein
VIFPLVLKRTRQTLERRARWLARVMRDCRRGEHRDAIDDERHVAWCRYGGGESYQDVWHELFARCLDCGRREHLGRVVVWGTNRRAPHPWLPDDA